MRSIKDYNRSLIVWRATSARKMMQRRRSACLTCSERIIRLRLLSRKLRICKRSWQHPRLSQLLKLNRPSSLWDRSKRAGLFNHVKFSRRKLLKNRKWTDKWSFSHLVLRPFLLKNSWCRWHQLILKRNYLWSLQRSNLWRQPRVGCLMLRKLTS